MDAIFCPLEYYQEQLRGRWFNVYSDHKTLRTLGTLHMTTMIRLELGMLDFDFEIPGKNGSENPQTSY